jgi:DNA-binding response OmpR family regulator
VHASTADPNPHVLVVEDDKLVSWSLSRLLTKWGFQVDPVSTGRDAVERCRAGYDIVLLDYQLPDVDGLEVARSMRAALPGLVIILMTALDRDELTIPDGLIDVYFNKPVAFEALRRVMARYQGVRRDRDPGAAPAPGGTPEEP